MRLRALLALPLLAACSGGGLPTILGDVSVIEGGTPGLEPGGPGTGPLGHAGFALLLNDVRAEGGIRMVTQNAILTGTAQDHAQDMVRNDYLSHTDLDGGRAGDRVLAAGYDWDFIAENIAQGFTDDAAVMAAWMGSASHRDNILDGRADEFGIGLDGTTWVLLLGHQFRDTAVP